MWMIISTGHPENDRAKAVKHSGIRAGEIIGYRAWRVAERSWLSRNTDRLCSVYVSDYVWELDRPASGDVRTHGIYSFRSVVRSKAEYAFATPRSVLLFGKVKIWGEVIEHERGYRSEFARIISLDYGNPDLLTRFRKIYRLDETSN
jgi:hypothetical protein